LIVRKREMRKAATFDEVLEAADRLSLEEQETIMEILRKRLIDERRKELAKEVREAQKEFSRGGCRPISSEEVLKELLS
jgi:hypothetical protein